MDIADKAQQQNEINLSLMIAQIKAQSQQTGQIDCEDCGEEIPAARRAVCPSAIRCVSCQEENERKK